MSGYNFTESKLKGAYIIEPNIIGDQRGYFFESYTKRDFVAAGINVEFVQDNESRSRKGVLRGLHFQTKQSQGKLVKVVEGEVYDVLVDLRKGSRTFGLWEAVRLSADNKTMLYIPKGFAHGFLVLSETAVFQYKCTDYYAAEYEAGLMWNDPEIGIEWPLDEIEEVLLSDKDKRNLSFKEFCLQEEALE